ncbi:MAG: hypothetical protein II157_01535 [Bacteroidales bacterium]|nr:hypothetical protein [Bacteroidales bacterium]
MEEKKGLLSALAETLKQYELNQADDKESMAIALEEKLDEIAKMISSLSDRIDNLSSRVNHIGEKVDILENRAAEPVRTPEEDIQTPEPVFDEEKAEEEVLISGTAEPVFDSAEVDDNFHNADDEDYEDLDDEMEEEGEIEEVEEGEIEEEGEMEDEGEMEEDEQEAGETEAIAPEETEEVPEEKAEEVYREENPDAAKASKDWYDWEYDYPAEYVENLMESMGINDKLEFVRELFNSDPMMFDSQMKEIDTMPNFKAIVQFFRQAHPEWDESSETVYRFYMHVRRKFRN